MDARVPSFWLSYLSLFPSIYLYVGIFPLMLCLNTPFQTCMPQARGDVWWTLGFATYEHRTGEVLDVGGEVDEVLPYCHSLGLYVTYVRPHHSSF